MILVTCCILNFEQLLVGFCLIYAFKLFTLTFYKFFTFSILLMPSLRSVSFALYPHLRIPVKELNWKAALKKKTLLVRARNIEKLEKTTKLSFSSSFRISMWIAIHSFMFHYNLMSGCFYGAWARGLHSKALAKI